MQTVLLRIKSPSSPGKNEWSFFKDNKKLSRWWRDKYHSFVIPAPDTIAWFRLRVPPFRNSQQPFIPKSCLANKTSPTRQRNKLVNRTQLKEVLDLKNRIKQGNVWKAPGTWEAVVKCRGNHCCYWQWEKTTVRKVRRRKTNTAWYHLRVGAQKAKLIKTKSKTVVTWGGVGWKEIGYIRV